MKNPPKTSKRYDPTLPPMDRSMESVAKFKIERANSVDSETVEVKCPPGCPIPLPHRHLAHILHEDEGSMLRQRDSPVGGG